ncbi:hypothetical protein MP638_006081 [Amoeboaphelidium occidentale]|nr:hypothetical protein MP638_006081 [Amoeboaphelidium occidentale]
MFNLAKLKIAHPVNSIPQALIGLKDAAHITKSLAVGRKDHPVALDIQCSINDSAAKELRGIVVLPHSFLKTRTLIFTEDNDHIDVLKKQNADVIVGGEELIEKVVNNELQFDRVISTPEMYKKITKPLARILGPRGIMPTEKKGTVTANVISALKTQSDAIVFKADSNAFISTVIGKVGLSSQQLVENIETFLQEIKSIKKGNKDKFIEKLVLKTKETPEILFKTDSNLHQ